jgi:putative acetyltransferase
VTIGPGSPREADVARLIEELDAYLSSLYPAQSNHLLDVETLCGEDIRFFVARSGGEAVGCGALRVDMTGYGEVKRMFVSPSARGMNLGRRILSRIEAQAREEGLSCLRLETGIHQREALGLYRSAGFVDCEPFGNYRPDPLSVFMEKTLR